MGDCEVHTLSIKLQCALGLSVSLLCHGATIAELWQEAEAARRSGQSASTIPQSYPEAVAKSVLHQERRVAGATWSSTIP